MSSAEQAAKAYALDRVPLDARIEADAPFWRIEIDLAFERGAQWQRERPVTDAELETKVSQLRCETSAYRIDLKRLYAMERRLKEAIENSDASVCDIVAPEDLRYILAGKESSDGN